MKLLIAIAVCLPLLQQQEPREWSSSDGNYKVIAELLSFDGTTVKLKKADGKIVSVPASRLSDSDQKILAATNSPKSPKVIDKELRSELRDIGLRYSKGQLTLLRENEFSRRLSDSNRLLKSLKESAKTLDELKRRQYAWKLNRDQLRVLNVNLNAALSNATSVSENNRLVGALNANQSKIELITSDLERVDNETKRQRVKSNDLREEYIALIMEMRKLSNKIQEEVANADANEKFKIAIDKLETLTETEVKLSTSRNFARAQKKLQALEDTVLTESIPLHKDPSGTMRVTATFDSGKTLDMVLDSGASLILLTRQNADDLGIAISDSAPTIIMTVADGRQIQGKRISLASVRLGKFTATNVDCAVLDGNAIFAEPLLGMSFLSNFKFEVDADAETLTMVKISD